MLGRDLWSQLMGKLWQDQYSRFHHGLLPYCNSLANGLPERNGSSGERAAIAAEARGLPRGALKAALASLDGARGHLYASLVTVASEPDGAPIVLISTPARHAQNLPEDARASFLFGGTGGLGDPLEGARVSVWGRAEKTDNAAARRRFLARHPSAAGYAGFADFAFWRLAVEGGRFVGGFGRAHDLAAGEPPTGAEALIEAEEEIVAHMNEDHADAIELYAIRLLGARPGAWRMSGCGPERCNLVLDDAALRLAFPRRVTTPHAAREPLVALAKRARG